MFHLDQNVNNRSFQVKDDAENSIAEGYYAVDVADRSVLVLVTRINLMPSSYDQIDRLLSTVELHFGQSNHARVFTWLPSFDGQFHLSAQKVHHKGDVLMMVDTVRLKYDRTTDDFNHEQYQLITSKEMIVTYATVLKEMMRANAFWAKEWTEQEMQDRVHSASGAVLVVDRTNNEPCAFGRIFTVTSNQDQEETFAYLSDIAVSSQHQNKRLGLLVVNTLVKMFLHGHDSEKLHGMICLCCADQGVGAVAAPKLYKKFGFEFSKQMQHCIALVHTDQYYRRGSS